MPEIDQNLILFVSQENGIGMEKLLRKMKIGNRNTFYELIKSLEEQGNIETKKIGRTRHVYLNSPDKKVNHFIKTFGNRLELYEKEINKNLALLEKNLPLISEKQPMKPVKIKVPQLKRIRKKKIQTDQGIKEQWDYAVQGTINQHAMTWKTRAKPQKHFDAILNLLHKLYQESSVLTFGDTFTDDTTIIKGYQEHSEKLIKNTCTKIEDMFRDKIDFTYAITRLRQSIYALIYKLTLKEEIKKLEKSSSIL